MLPAWGIQKAISANRIFVVDGLYCSAYVLPMTDRADISAFDAAARSLTQARRAIRSPSILRIRTGRMARA